MEKKKQRKKGRRGRVVGKRSRGSGGPEGTGKANADEEKEPEKSHNLQGP